MQTIISICWCILIIIFNITFNFADVWLLLKNLSPEMIPELFFAVQSIAIISCILSILILDLHNITLPPECRKFFGFIFICLLHPAFNKLITGIYSSVLELNQDKLNSYLIIILVQYMVMVPYSLLFNCIYNKMYEPGDCEYCCPYCTI